MYRVLTTAVLVFSESALYSGQRVIASSHDKNAPGWINLIKFIYPDYDSKLRNIGEPEVQTLETPRFSI